MFCCFLDIDEVAILAQVKVNAGAFALAADFASSRRLSQLCAEFNMANVLMQVDDEKKRKDREPESAGAEGPATFKTPRTGIIQRPADLAPLQAVPQAPQMVDISKLESMFEKFTTKFSKDVKNVGDKLDRHVDAMKVGHADMDKRIIDHDARLDEATAQITRMQNDLAEIRKTLANAGTATRGASAPPAGARKAGHADLSVFEHSQAQISPRAFQIPIPTSICLQKVGVDTAENEPPKVWR